MGDNAVEIKKLSTQAIVTYRALRQSHHLNVAFPTVRWQSDQETL